MNVRLIAAANTPEPAQAGRFREDLYSDRASFLLKVVVKRGIRWNEPGPHTVLQARRKV